MKVRYIAHNIVIEPTRNPWLQLDFTIDDKLYRSNIEYMLLTSEVQDVMMKRFDFQQLAEELALEIKRELDLNEYLHQVNTITDEAKRKEIQQRLRPIKIASL